MNPITKPFIKLQCRVTNKGLEIVVEARGISGTLVLPAGARMIKTKTVGLVITEINESE